MIDEAQTSATPDLLLYDDENKRNVVIIEVSSNDGAKKDFEKVVGLVQDYEVAEGFVYNYQKKTWKKFDLEKGEIEDNPSYCTSIGYDLKQFV